MAKYEHTPITSGFSSQTKINENFESIEENLERVLYRDGSTPNQMLSDLDMNSKRIYNLPSASSPTEPVTYAQWSAGAQVVTFTGTVIESQSATAGQTVVNLLSSTYEPGSNNLSVYVNGVRQAVGAYVENSASQFTFSEGLDDGDLIEIVINERQVDSSAVPASSVTVTVDGVNTNVAAVLANEFPIVVDTVAAMQALTGLTNKRRVITRGYTSVDDGGHGEYLYYATPPGTEDNIEYFDQTTGGGQFVLQHDGSIRASQAGILGDGSNELAKCQALVTKAVNVYWDRKEIYLGPVVGSLFILYPQHNNIIYKGSPTRFVMDGDNTAAVNLFRVLGGHDIVIEDIEGEDTVNKAPTAVAQVGVDFINIPDMSSGPNRGTYRLRLVRPKMFGGRSLLTCSGVTYNTTANDVTIIDGHAEDTYYGLNTAASGYGLRANYRCIRVKRAYFPYDVSNQDVTVYSEDPQDSNAHFLLKSYDPAKGLKDIRLKATVSGDTVAGRGRLVFEHQDETTDLSKFENVFVDFTDNRTLETQSIFFRAFSDPVTVRTTTNGTMKNIRLTGKYNRLSFLSKPSTMDKWDIWSQGEHATSVSLSYPRHIGYSEINLNENCLGVAFRDGVRRWLVGAEGVAGPGLAALIPFAMFNNNAGDQYYNMIVRLSAFQGTTNTSSYYIALTVSRIAGVYTIGASAQYAVSFRTGAVITFTVAVSGTDLSISSAALGGNQYGIFSFEIV